MMPSKFKTIIKRARIKKGYSQTKLGDLVECWGTYVGQFEKGTRIPSDKMILALAKCLDLDPRRLLLLAWRDRSDIGEVKKLLDVILQLLEDPVVMDLMDVRVHGDGESLYQVVEKFTKLTHHNQRVVTDLIQRLGTPDRGKKATP